MLAGTVAASGANAAPRFMSPVPFVAAPPIVQPVQYYEDGRYRNWRRHEEIERFRRREAWRHERHEEHEHGRVAGRAHW